jgi:hypothetical protein
MYAACVKMLTPPDGVGDVEVDAKNFTATAIDTVEVELHQQNAHAGGSSSTTCQAAFWKLHSDRLAHASVSTMRMIKPYNGNPGIPWDKIETSPG